jgi:hypothetical protein
MTPIDVLKKGLKTLRKQTDARELKIQADLNAQKSITESDEAWLDGEGNLVDEERLIDLLKMYDIEDDIRPTRNEALQAALVVKKYIQELNSDPFTRKLEAIIDTFGWQTHLVEVQSLKPMLMTDYSLHT